MTACAIEPPSARDDDDMPRAGCTITVDGAYAARLAGRSGFRYPERWTLDGPEPYAVPLPGPQPEEPGTEVQPMGDGRVLIRRPVAARHDFALLYPTGPGTGELPLGAVQCPDVGTRLRLLPPTPGGERAYALVVGRRSTAVWLVAGGAFGPQLVAEIPGRCSGGVWLDRAGRMLALDREIGGRTKAVVVDLERGGEMSPLLQIAAHSQDRLLLADPDSGLLLISSDAPSPGHDRLGWGVLGSTLPVRFPDCLRLPDCVVTPFAIQPGQILTPEHCAVALRIDGSFGSWIGVWRPAERQLVHVPAPEGWLAGAGLWTGDGELRLPYATGAVPCGVARLGAPGRVARGVPAVRAEVFRPGGGAAAVPPVPTAGPAAVQAVVQAAVQAAEPETPSWPRAGAGAETPSWPGAGAAAGAGAESSSWSVAETSPQSGSGTGTLSRSGAEPARSVPEAPSRSVQGTASWWLPVTPSRSAPESPSRSARSVRGTGSWWVRVTPSSPEASARSASETPPASAGAPAPPAPSPTHGVAADVPPGGLSDVPPGALPGVPPDPAPGDPRELAEPEPPGPVAPRPVPLQQAPLGRLVTK